MQDWALIVAVVAIFYAWNAKDKAEEAHTLARDALYEAQSAKTKANEAAARADEVGEAVGR